MKSEGSQGKSCMNLQSHNKDSGFCSKHARKPTGGFETRVWKYLTWLLKGQLWLWCVWGSNFVIQNPITRVLKMIFTTKLNSLPLSLNCSPSWITYPCEEHHHSPICLHNQPENHLWLSLLPHIKTPYIYAT